MPFVPVANVALAELRMTLESQDVENTLWFRFGSTPTAAMLTDLNNELLAWWIDAYAPLVSTAVSLREIVCTDQTSATGPQVSLPAPPGSDGTDSAPPLPNNVTLAVSFRTALRGRSFRGRNYIVGITEDSNTGSEVTGAYASAVSAAYEQLLSGGGVLGDEIWVVASRFSGVDVNGHPIPRVAGISTPITSVVVVDLTIDSQRRRLPGRGH